MEIDRLRASALGRVRIMRDSVRVYYKDINTLLGLKVYYRTNGLIQRAMLNKKPISIQVAKKLNTQPSAELYIDLDKGIIQVVKGHVSETAIVALVAKLGTGGSL